MSTAAINRLSRRCFHCLSSSSRGSRRSFSTGAASAQQPMTSCEDNTWVTTLDNGLRVVSEDLGTMSSCVGLWIDAGSRYETQRNNGVAHFLEHMIFKGTSNRTQLQLELQVENMGAALNAYTSREQTVYYAKCFSKDLETLVDLLADILTNSTLDRSNINRERGVILREMQEVESNLQEVVFDHVHEAAFANSPLGFTILGPDHNINSINRPMLLDYIHTHYVAPRIVLAGAGGFPHHELVRMAEKYLGKLPRESHLSWQLTPYKFTGCDFKAVNENLDLAHVVLAVEGCGWANPDIIPLMVANMILGTWDRSQSLFSSTSNPLARACLRDQLCYSYQCFNTCYLDTGLWGVHFVGDAANLNKMISATAGEFLRLCHSATAEEVERAKRALKTNMMLQLDGTTQICEEIGRQMLCYGRRIPMGEMRERIDAVTVHHVKKVLSAYIVDQPPVLVGVGPVADMMSFNDLLNELK